MKKKTTNRDHDALCDNGLELNKRIESSYLVSFCTKGWPFVGKEKKISASLILNPTLPQNWLVIDTPIQHIFPKE